MIKKLIESGANIKVGNVDQSILWYSIHHNNSDMFEFILSQGMDINYRDISGTPLMFASQKGNLNFVEKLIFRGADLDVQDNQGYTALMLAVVNIHLNIVKKLIDKKANPLIKNSEGKTAKILIIEQKLKYEKRENKRTAELVQQTGELSDYEIREINTTRELIDNRNKIIELLNNYEIKYEIEKLRTLPDTYFSVIPLDMISLIVKSSREQ